MKIGMTFATGYEFRVARHTNSLTAIIHWRSNNQAALVAAAAEHLLCEAGITANSKNPPAQEKHAHFAMLDHVTGLLRDVRLPNNVRHAFLNAMDVLHIAISCFHGNPGLAVSLSVASIEAGAECFFGKDRSQLLNEKETGEIKAADSLGKALKKNYKEMLSKEDFDFIGTLVGNTKTLYHEQRHYTLRKFLVFCDKFAPFHLWDELARHPYYEIPGGNNLIMMQSPFSATPSQIDEADLRTLLEETYAFRNKYVHCAQQPAALATSTPDTYFETLFGFDEECIRRAIKPALIIGIARKALVSWLEHSLVSSQGSSQSASLI